VAFEGGEGEGKILIWGKKGRGEFWFEEELGFCGLWTKVGFLLVEIWVFV